MSVLSIQWQPGTDVLVGICHCGASHQATDPIELWAWLFDHPEHRIQEP